LIYSKTETQVFSMDRISLFGAAIACIGFISLGSASLVPVPFFKAKRGIRSAFYTAGLLLSMLGMLILAVKNPI
jgi:hypothetical protein